MNIWIFNHYAVGPGSSGITRHYDLAKELVKLGHEVTIFASSFNHQKRIEEQEYNGKSYYKIEKYDGVNFYWIKTTPYYKNDFSRVLNMFSYTKNANSISSKVHNKPDVVIGSLMHPLAAVLGLRVAKRTNAKFLFEERDLWPQSLIDLGKVSKKSPLVFFLSRLEKYLYRSADKIIVLFENAVNYVKSTGINESKVIYLPNGVDISRYNSKRSLEVSMQESLAEHRGKFIAVYTGAHGLANNLDIILEAAEYLKTQDEDIQFLLVGDGPEKKRLMEWKEKKQLDNVSFINSVPKEFIPSILQQCDIGLLPLQNSPVFQWGISPNKMYDYMAASLPIALLCNIEEPTIINSGAGFIIKEKFAKNLADLLVMLKDDENLKQLKGENGRRYLEEKHTWDKLAQKFLFSIGSEANDKHRF
ncbi:glycosyltransferase family 4 protein [Pseudobacillus wudalianchiensis]|uniref:glycosyltransferase family 4 protein n=1 Tax=Pseudobacillus wudalianchiensis TaxID=1743143 RepID=UPI000808761E|nr:glycosyltransferase family 4 protein [Bacillus wudalianchiensis]